jgi:hypothetical protein
MRGASLKESAKMSRHRDGRIRDDIARSEQV